MNLTTAEKRADHPRWGGDCMKGSYHWHDPAQRFYVSLFHEGKRYRIWRYNGDPIYHEKTANKLLNKIRAEIDDGVFLPKSYMPDSPVSIQTYSEQWLKTLSVAKATLNFYQKEIKHAISYFGPDQDIRKFTYSKLTMFYKDLPLSIKGKYHALNTLKTMLKCAYQDEILKKMPPFPTLHQPPQQDIKYLTYDQQQEVLKNIREADRPIIEFAMEYGLRIGEVIGLQKDCITESEITIKRAMSLGELRQSTKTGKMRVFGITDRAKQILDNLPLAASPYVFNRNGKPYSWKMLTKAWRAACKAAGIEINLYNAIRHSLGCQLMDSGVEMEMVRDILGHTNSAMTRRYAQRAKQTVTNVLQFRGRLEYGNAEKKVNEIK